MKNQLLKTDLIVTDNIKDYFCLFYWSENEFHKSYDSSPQVFCGYRDFTRWTPLYKPILTNKFQFIMFDQITKLHHLGLRGDEVINFIEEKININKIPIRYKPRIIQVNNAFQQKIKLGKKTTFDSTGKRGRPKLITSVFPHGFDKEIKLYQIIFYEPIISLIEQRFDCELSKKIVNLFKSLNEHDGMDFEEYIDKWYNKLVENFFPSRDQLVKDEV